MNSAEEAYAHFLGEGKREGAKGSPACDQGYLLRFVQSLNPELMLEIGPGCSPKLKGDNVRYFDVKSKQELQHRYRNEPGFDNIPTEIHYVNESGFLTEIEDRFDVVFSSHAIEHTLDLIAHLKEVEQLLSPNGIYVLVIPNKKFTFDHFKPVSILEDVLATHFEKSRPSLSLRSMLMEAHRRAHNIPARHWANDHGDLAFDKRAIIKNIASFQQTASNGVAASGYHNWIFDEDSFAEIVTQLHELELISLRVVAIYNTPHGGMSFSAILGRR